MYLPARFLKTFQPQSSLKSFTCKTQTKLHGPSGNMTSVTHRTVNEFLGLIMRHSSRSFKITTQIALI
jgi:hypothetical protein